MLGQKPKEKIRKIDILITSVVLGTIVAGAFGLKKKTEAGEPSLWKKILRSIVGKD